MYISRRVVAVLFVFGWSFLVATALVLTCRPLLAEQPGHDFWMSILLTSCGAVCGTTHIGPEFIKYSKNSVHTMMSDRIFPDYLCIHFILPLILPLND